MADDVQDDLEQGDGPLAAVDLGSNSFHMVIAQVLAGEIRVIDRVRERVHLASGLDPNGHLDSDARERALSCLRRFGERVRDVAPNRVRAVGTNTLRKAKNGAKFLVRAQEALGHPIEVIPGAEEARLIYLGVSHTLSGGLGRHLVIDIGGGSTDCVVGERFEPLRTESLHMGCVSYTRRFFKGNKIEREAFRKAELAARRELQTLERRFKALGWDTCVGASGTILAIHEILRQNGWSEGGISRTGLRKLRKAMVAAGNVNELQLPGLKPERAPVLAGGLAILHAAFKSLEIEHMRISEGALREGVLYDLLGRMHHEDVRDRTIRSFEERYQIDVEQAARVEATSLLFLGQVVSSWKLEAPFVRSLLSWAARLHELGLAVSYSSQHKHGAYLITHADMPGFSLDGKHVLAALVRCHRRKLSRALFPDVLGFSSEKLLRLCMLLRLSALLNRSRSERPLPAMLLRAKKRELDLTLPSGWLAENPLTRGDLEVEVGYLNAVGYSLVTSELEPATSRARSFHSDG